MESRIGHIAGITSVRAEHPERQIVVHYDPDRISITDTRSAVEKVAGATMHRNADHAHDQGHGSAGLLLSAALWLIGIVLLLPGARVPLFRAITLSDAFLALAAVIGGWPVLCGAWRSLRRRQLGVNALIAIAAIGAAALGELFEAASLVVLFGASEWLEHRASAKARRVAETLLEETPDTAITLREGRELVLPVEAVEVGEHVRVRPGDRIGLDGVVHDGHSWVDESAITGESTPAAKSPGDTIYAGSLNCEGALEILTTCEAKGSTIARIAELVSDAMARRPKIQRLVDRFAKIYTPIVVGLSIYTAVLPVLFGQPARPWIMSALTMLVVSCPCAFVISLPATLAAALHAGARNGLIIKGGEYLERVARTSLMSFDKTGTLTTGNLTADVIATSECDAGTVLQLAASLEARSEHAIGAAILARAHGVEKLPVEGFRVFPGRGVSGIIAGGAYLLGNRTLFPSNVLAASTLATQDDCAVLLGTKTGILGGFSLSDRVRDESHAVVASLKELGIRSVMVTGDRNLAAQRTARVIGIPEAHGSLLPEDKLVLIDRLRAHNVVCMVGDGINDAPALAAADVGVAMGLSAATTAEAADIVLSAGGLRGLPKLIRLARRAFRIARWNMIIAFVLKCIVAGLAVFGFTSLALAVVVGDVGATLLVTANAVRLSRAKLTI